jgi:exodeoxyribonuclease VIII
MRREIVKNMSNEDYHKSPGISNSGFNLMKDCPKRYWAKYIYKAEEPYNEELTQALKIGKSVHTLALEPSLFYLENLVLPKLDRRRTEDKKIYQDAELSGKNLLKPEEFELASNMAEALKSNKDFKRFVKNGETENSLFWEEDGIILRSRPDYYNNFCVCEIKTTNSAEKFSFQKAIAEYGYHRQAAMQLDILQNLTGIKRNHFCFFIVESKFPFITASFRLDDEAIQMGRREIQELKEIYKKCLEKNEWPGYQEDIEDIHLPSWY